MEYLTNLLYAAVFIAFLYKTSCYSCRGIWITGAVLFVFVWAVMPEITEIPAVALLKYYTQPQWRHNVTFVLLADTAMSLYFCFRAAAPAPHNPFQRIGFFLSKYGAGFSISGIICSLLAATLYASPGIGFITAALLVSSAVFATVTAGAFAVKKIGGDTLLRLDTLYTIHIFIVILCIVINGC